MTTCSSWLGRFWAPGGSLFSKSLDGGVSGCRSVRETAVAAGREPAGLRRACAAGATGFLESALRLFPPFNQFVLLIS